MNNDTPFTTIGDEPVEARIVAWVLGEASTFEAADLERLCGERPELMVFKRRMLALHGLLAEAEKPPTGDSWKLPPEKRKTLDEIFGGENPIRLEVEKEKRIRHSGRRAFLAIAACLILTVIIAGLMAPAVIRQRKKSDLTEARNLKLQNELAAAESSDSISSGRMQRLETTFPAELIEGTPKPIILPGLEMPVDGPADRKRQLAELGKAVRDQEDKVEERRKVLATMARTKGVIYKSNDRDQSVEQRESDAREESIKRGLDAQDYVDAKREFETDQALLQTMKLKQMGETMSRRSPSDSVEIIESPPMNLAMESKKSEAAPAKPATPRPAAQPAADSDPVSLRGASSGSGSFSRDSQVAACGPVGGRSQQGQIEESARNVAASPARSRDERPRVAGKLFEESEDESLMVQEKEVSSSSELRRLPTAPSASMAKIITTTTASPTAVLVPDLDVNTPALDFGDADDFGSNWGGSVETMDRFSESAIQVVENPVGGTLEVEESGERAEGLEIAGGAKYKLQTGPTSEYFFRGADLGDSEAAQQLDTVREFQYPTESEPPELPNAASEAAAIPGTPATPTSRTSQEKGRKAKPATPKIDFTELMEEISATEDPYSTFSLNISDASFQIAQAALAKGEQPDPAGIKVEQFYNAVDYGDPAPSAGEPVAVAIEQSAHPVIPGRNLVRVALKTAAAGRSASQPLRLTLLVDQSGSMVREDRRTAMEKALAGLAGLLTEKDSVSVVGFSRTPRLLADSMPGNQAKKLADLVNQSASEGGTNLEEAIKLAKQMAERNQLAGAQNRIVLFTDGAANLGNADPVRLAEKVKQLRQKGIAFDIAGIAADGLNDELLGELARNGNGRYYVVGKGADDNFAKQLAGAFRPAAENVKVQVRFNPERVGRYKLIGFEKDRLKTEDFRNDAVDAAELAAEEAGVAIYQVEPLPGGTGELGEVSVRFRDATSAQMVERTWTIPHDSGAPAIDRATPSMQLAVLSMLAAEKLKGGPLADAIDFQQLAESRANVKGFYGNTGRVGEVLGMLDALK